MNIKTDKKEYIRKLIIDEVGEQLTNTSILNINLDNISKELHVSKRTIYEIFDSKENIIHTAVDLLMENLTNLVDSVTLKIKDDKISFKGGMLEIIQFLNNSFFANKEYNRLFPDRALELQNKSKKTFINFIELAKEKKFFRDDVNSEAIFHLIRIVNISLFDKNFRKQYGFTESLPIEVVMELIH
jgi:AcrR family transcriptional regulator